MYYLMVPAVDCNVTCTGNAINNYYNYKQLFKKTVVDSEKNANPNLGFFRVLLDGKVLLDEYTWYAAKRHATAERV